MESGSDRVEPIMKPGPYTVYLKIKSSCFYCFTNTCFCFAILIHSCVVRLDSACSSFTHRLISVPQNYQIIAFIFSLCVDC
ncbi:unnamed protein product [Lathyrus oleraceus]